MYPLEFKRRIYTVVLAGLQLKIIPVLLYQKNQNPILLITFHLLFIIFNCSNAYVWLPSQLGL